MMAGDILIPPRSTRLPVSPLNPLPQVKRHGDRPCARAGPPEVPGRRQSGALEPGKGAAAREFAFRLDFPRKRDLYKIAIASAGAAEVWPKPKRLADAPPLLLSSRRYAPERIERAPGSEFHLEAKRETSFLRSGGGRVGKFAVATGEAALAQSEVLNIETGLDGLTSLVAYKGVGDPAPYPLQRLTQPRARDAAAPEEMRMPRSPPQTKATPVHGHVGTVE